jgi:hypothetical protein
MPPRAFSGKVGTGFPQENAKEQKLERFPILSNLKMLYARELNRRRIAGSEQPNEN